MIHIRGENVYPTEVDNYLRGVSGYGGEHQIVVRRTGSMDEMIVRAETTHPGRRARRRSSATPAPACSPCSASA